MTGKKPNVELIEDIQKDLENETTRDVIVEHRFYETIIGARGDTNQEIKDQRKNQVQITFSDPGKKSDIVQFIGPKDGVDKYLLSMQTDLIASNYKEEHIVKDFHQNIIGKGGSSIKKENETTRDIMDEHRFHETFIGDRRDTNQEIKDNSIQYR